MLSFIWVSLVYGANYSGLYCGASSAVAPLESSNVALTYCNLIGFCQLFFAPNASSNHPRVLRSGRYYSYSASEVRFMQHVDQWSFHISEARHGEENAAVKLFSRRRRMQDPTQQPRYSPTAVCIRFAKHLPAPSSQPLRMPNSDLRANAYPAVETLADLLVRPEDSASQRRHRSIRESFTHRSAERIDVVHCLFRFPLQRLPLDSHENGRAVSGLPKTEKSTMVTMGNFDGNAEDVSHHHLQFARH